MGTLGALGSVVDQAVAALGPLLVPVWALWAGGPRYPLPLDGAWAWAGAVLVPVLGAGFGALRCSNMLYPGRCPSCGRCIPRSWFACFCRLVVQSLRVHSVYVGQDIQRSAFAVPCFRM